MERFYEPTKTLAELGFNPVENSSFIEENLIAYELHTIKDLPVSRVYCYYRGPDGKFYCDVERQLPIPVDPQERGGGYIIGIDNALNMAVSHPEKVVVLYSPPGPVVFDEGDEANLFREIRYYSRGQLYLIWSEDGDEIKNIALTTDENSFPLIKRLLQSKAELVEKAKHLQELQQEDSQLTTEELSTEKSIIYRLITSPTLTSRNINQIIEELVSHDEILYQSVNGATYTGRDLAHLLVYSLRGELKGELAEIYQREAYETYLLGGVTEQKILELYQRMLIDYMVIHNLESLPLGGSCGGREVSLRELMGMSPETGFNIISGILHSNLHTGSLSTEWRRANESILKCVTCPQCKNVVDAIVKYGKIVCPKCKAEADYTSI